MIWFLIMKGSRKMQVEFALTKVMRRLHGRLAHGSRCTAGSIHLRGRVLAERIPGLEQGCRARRGNAFWSDGSACVQTLRSRGNIVYEIIIIGASNVLPARVWVTVGGSEEKKRTSQWFRRHALDGGSGKGRSLYSTPSLEIKEELVYTEIQMEQDRGAVEATR